MVSQRLLTIFDANKTGIYSGSIYSNAAIGQLPARITPRTDQAGLAVTITTTVPHGLSLGNPIAISGIGTTNNATNLNGSYVVHRIQSQNQFTIYSPFPIPTNIGIGAGYTFLANVLASITVTAASTKTKLLYYANTTGFSIAATSATIGNTTDRKSTRLNSSHVSESRMPSSA